MNVTRGLLNAYGSYQEYYSTTRFSNRSDTAIAWIGTVQATLVIVLGVVTGPIYDKGYVRELMLVGAFLTVFGFMMLSLATQYWQVFLAQGVCTGIGSGIIYIPSLALVATSFSKHRALAIAIATSGAATGGIIFPAALESLLPEVGFAWSTRILGFMCLFCFVVGLAILLPRTTRCAKPPRSFFDLMAFTDVPFMLLSIALYFMFLAYWVPFFFIPAFGLAGVGASPRYSVYLLVITNAATVPGRLLSAVIATKLGPSRLGPMSTMLGATICSGILLFGWLGVTSLAGYDVWVVIFGIFIGPLTVLAPTVIPQLCPDESVVGTRLGMAWAASALGILTGAPLASTIIDPKTGKFWPLQVLVGTSMMIGAACLIPVWIHLWRMTRSA